MDSDDNHLLDAYDGDSAEDYYCSDSGGDSDMAEFITGGDNDNDDVDVVNDGGDYGYAIDEDAGFRSERNYAVLKESDIQRRQEESISHVSAVLSISRVAASILLCHYKWNVSQLQDEWFADEERVRRTVGLLPRPGVWFPNAKELTCEICFDSHPLDQIHSAVCGHPYCTICWKGYITTAINDGPGCLLLRCPHPSCRTAVGQDMIRTLASDEDKEKYSRYLFRSYIEEQKKTKWCPAPDCDNAVEFEIGSNVYDVICLCSHAFCWNCTEEAHRPVDCGTVSKWILKNSAESENMNWILAYSKPCPNCKRPIEKDQGCTYMTCAPPCNFEFCWLCLDAWADHGETTGGYYACNRYEAAKQEGVYDESEKRREMAKNSLDRYLHYYERWAGNKTSREKAIADLHRMQTVNLRMLSDELKEPESQLTFIIEAWKQIIECRQVLRWTCAYGYYLPGYENAKRQLFEYLQGEAESGLERLHNCAEKDVMSFLGYFHWPLDFNAFRPKLAGLTRVTHSYFENLVRELENGLSDVNTEAACSTSVGSKNAGGASKAKGGKGKGSASRSGQSATRDADDDHWNCDRCTFANSDSATSCQMCHNDR